MKANTISPTANKTALAPSDTLSPSPPSAHTLTHTPPLCVSLGLRLRPHRAAESENVIYV